MQDKNKKDDLHVVSSEDVKDFLQYAKNNHQQARKQDYSQGSFSTHARMDPALHARFINACEYTRLRKTTIMLDALHNYLNFLEEKLGVSFDEPVKK